MPAQRLTFFPPWVSYLLSVVLVGLTTLLVQQLQHALIEPHVTTVRPYGIAFVIPIAIVTSIGGRGPGLLALALSLYSTRYVLIHHVADRREWLGLSPRDWVELGFIFLVGLLVIFGMDAIRRNAQLLAAAQAQAAREALLNEILQQQRRADTEDDILQTTLERLGQSLNADRCYFSRYDVEDQTLVVTHDWHRADLATLKGRWPLSPIRRGGTRQAALIVPDGQSDDVDPLTNDLMRRGHIRALASVHLQDAGEGMTALTLAMADTPRDWLPEDVALLQRVVVQTQASLSISRASRRERNIAAILQEALLPSKPETVPGLDVAPFYKPALAEANIGGDFYDVFEISESAFALVVGDVSGKGLAAAVQVAIVRNMLRCLLYREPTLAEAVTQLNTIVSRHSLLTGFVTLFVGVYQAATQTLEYVSCGHEPALLRRESTQAIEELGPTGPILGAMDGLAYDSCQVRLSPGDAVAIYTDGVTDAGPSPAEFLGGTGLSALLGQAPRGVSAAALAARLIQGVESHARGPLRDDACLLTAVA